VYKGPVKLTGDVKQRTNKANEERQKQYRAEKQNLQNEEKYHRFLHGGKPHNLLQTETQCTSTSLRS